jgi:hypothetical protein
VSHIKRMTRLIIITLLLLYVNAQTIHLHHLIQNGNFEENFRHWAIREAQDTQHDLILPKLVTNKFPNPPPILPLEPSSKERVSLHMNLINDRYKQRQGIMQAIFPSQSNKLSDIRSPLLISFSHIIQNLVSGLIG